MIATQELNVLNNLTIYNFEFLQHVMQCTFTFIGQENERVSLDFEDFDLKGKAI